MNRKISREDWERLGEIKEEIKELVREDVDLIRDTNEYERAKGYWYAHIVCALDDDHMFLGGSMVTMQNTIDSFEDDVVEEDSEGDEEGEDEEDER